MRSSSLCPRLGLLLMLLALIANLLTRQGEAGNLARPNANAFPHQVAEWSSASDRPVAPIVYAALPTATISDRIYSNPQGETVELALVSAARSSDAHNPEECLPGMGWTLQNAQSLTQDGQFMRSAHAQQNGQEMSVLFWWDIPKTPATNWLVWAQKLRLKMNEHGTILVRLTTPATPHSETLLRAFAHQISPVLAAWKQTEKSDKTGK